MSRRFCGPTDIAGADQVEKRPLPQVASSQTLKAHANTASRALARRIGPQELEMVNWQENPCTAHCAVTLNELEIEDLRIEAVFELSRRVLSFRICASA